ncbi:APC family permease [Streptomyces capparidis]
MLTGRDTGPASRTTGNQPSISTYKGADRALRADRLGTFGMLLSVMAASAPLTVVATGMTLGYGVAQVKSQPLVYVLIGLVLALFAVGYSELSRHVHNAGAFYAYIARGLGGTMASGAAFVALVAYNAMQIALYGMFGAHSAYLLDKHAGVDVEWWVCALIGMALVTMLGVLKIDLSARVLGFLLIFECALVLVCDFAFLGDAGPSGVSLEAWGFGGLSGEGLGVMFCFAVAGFMGFESAPVYAEEAHKPQESVGRTTFLAVAVTAVFYSFSSWAIGVAAGPDKVVAASAEDGNLVLTMASGRVGSAFGNLLEVILLTSLFAALLSFHNAVARYFFAMGREGLLPKAVGRTSASSGAPALGSVLQSSLALLVVAAFAVTDSDPVLDLFSWMGNVGALGVILLMAATSVAVIVFFGRRGVARALAWRLGTAVLSAILLSGIFALAVAKFDVMLGSDPDSPLRWVLPGLIVAAAVLGLAYGVLLRSRRPEVHARIGLGNEAFQLERAAESEPVRV